MEQHQGVSTPTCEFEYIIDESYDGKLGFVWSGRVVDLARVFEPFVLPVRLGELTVK